MTPIGLVYEKILSVFPFLSKSERNLFVSHAKPLLKKYFQKTILKERIAVIRMLLVLLKNGHADLKEAPSRKRLPKKWIKQLEPTITLNKTILIITIPTWRMELKGLQDKLIKACTKYRKQYQAILIDVRSNGGGSSRTAHDFASIFFKKSVFYGTFVGKKNGRLKKWRGVLQPHKSIFIDVPIAILISEKCFSSNELFLAPFVVSKRALLIGRETRGGSANPLSLEIKIEKARMIVRIPQWRFFLRGKKQPIEKTKIKPNIRYIRSDIIQFAEKKLLKALRFHSH